jgi:acetyl esterase/lipase
MVEGILRQSAFPVGSDATEQRRLLRDALSGVPLPADVTVTAAALGDIPTAEITVDGIEPRHVVLYFHGGVSVIGDAFLAADLASQIGRRTQAKVISVDYRLAPEQKPSCRVASTLRTSSSRESRPAAASRSPRWSTPAITGCRCRPRPLSCHR